MKLASLAAFAALLVISAAAAQTTTERAPPAQQAAPPEKIGKPLYARQTPSAKIKRDVTTGAAPKELAPGHGKASSPRKIDRHTPSR